MATPTRVCAPSSFAPATPWVMGVQTSGSRLEVPSALQGSGSARDDAPPASMSPTQPAPLAYEKLGGRSSWTGADIKDSEWWGKQLTEEHLAELHEATHAAMSSGQLEFEGDVALGVTKENFPLAKTAELLAKMATELEHGQGATMLQGIPVENYSLRELGVMYLGMCSYIGHLVNQSSVPLPVDECEGTH